MGINIIMRILKTEVWIRKENSAWQV